MLNRLSWHLRVPLRHLANSTRTPRTRKNLKMIPVKSETMSIDVRNLSSDSDYKPNKYEFSTLKVTSPSEYVKQVELNRPDKRNAMNAEFWRDMTDCFNTLAVDEDCRAVVLSGAGKIFTAGLDLTGNDIFMKMMTDLDVGRKAFFLTKTIKELQEAFNVIEKCPKPVIAAVHSGCIGGGIDMICACDIRYCTQDAWFSIREVEIGIAADLGTLQRFQKITGNDSLTRELTYTARNFYSDEAKAAGLVSRTFLNKEEMIKGAVELASTIASKSPIAVQASKQIMVYSRDHSVPDSLEYQCQVNSALLQSEDVLKSAMAMVNKEKPIFSKL